MASAEQSLRAWVDYLHDMGVYDFYRREASRVMLSEEAIRSLRSAVERPAQVSPREAAIVSRGSTHPSGQEAVAPRPTPAVPPRSSEPASVGDRSAATVRLTPRAAKPPLPGTDQDSSEQGMQQLPPELAAPMPKPNPLTDLFAPPAVATPPQEKLDALKRLRDEIGDCTRCPLAYAGRHTIVFGEGNPNARLMFVGEGPGADEDQSGQPFVGKAGQLLNNMITAMGLSREQVYIANIVKCRPPGNRAPEFVEATTCSQFLLRQIDIVQPEVIVALGATAATYVLGVRQSLASLRDQWFRCRESRVAVTYHPAFLLRDPRQKPEAWKDLQRVMKELGLKPPARNG